jgi:small-conductance mechanosensitive channel
VIFCKHCGTELPDHASFCLQCGSPVTPVTESTEVEEKPPARPQGPQRELDFVQPALTGGMFLGFLSSIPFISIGNALCCMWVLLGGGIATVMLTKQRPSGVKYGDGAFVGVMSGLFGAVVGTIVQMSFRAMTSRMFEANKQQLEQIFQQYGIEGAVRDWTLRLASGEVSAATFIFFFFSNLVTFSLFAMIGGILTVALLNKRKGAGRLPRPDIPA